MPGSVFTLEALEAAHGDALLLHYGQVADPRLIVIDGGPPGIFKSSVGPRLKEVQANRGGGVLEIRMLMVSHIDDDHISGVLDLTKSLRELQDDHAPLPAPPAAPRSATTAPCPAGRRTPSRRW